MAVHVRPGRYKIPDICVVVAEDRRLRVDRAIGKLRFAGTAIEIPLHQLDED